MCRTIRLRLFPVPPARPLCHGPDPPEFSGRFSSWPRAKTIGAVRGLGLGPLARSFPPTVRRSLLFSRFSPSAK